MDFKKTRANFKYIPSQEHTNVFHYHGFIALYLLKQFVRQYELAWYNA